MTLLLPLGLIGLLSIALLVLIYVLRPNYQNKLVSTTFVWKLSMRYRKKRLPMSRLRNLLILICQLLLLASLAMMMAQPVVPITTGTSDNEKIAIIDASASMMVASGNQTRFQRALDRVRELAETTLEQEDGILSIIVADTEAYPAVTRATHENSDEAMSAIAELASGNACGYGSADIDGAAQLAEDILQINSRSEVIFYTATTHSGTGSFTVEIVASDDDWNAAILGVTPVLENTNTYSFDIDVGCFGLTSSVTITCDLYNYNGTISQATAITTEYFSDAEEQKTVTFNYNDFRGVSAAIYSFDYMMVSIDAKDSLQTDNTFTVYGGTKPVLNVQYSTSETDSFWSSGVHTAASEFRESWDIRLDQVAPANAVTEGFDLYIFEGTAPERMPDDGVVILSNPDRAPENADFTLSSEVTNVPFDTPFESLGQHPLTQYMLPSLIAAGSYRTVTSSDGYDELLSLDDRPVLFAKNTPEKKVILFTAGLQTSTFAVTEFAKLVYNIFNYYFPPTLQKNAYEVGEQVTINARGEQLKVDLPAGQGSLDSFESLPATITASTPGSYTVTQTIITGSPVTDNFFVHIPNAESNISRIADPLPEIFAPDTSEEGYDELILWFAIAAIVLFAAEWLLHSRENL